MPADVGGVQLVAPLAATAAIRSLADPRDESAARLAQFVTDQPMLPQFSETGKLITGLLQAALAGNLPAHLSSRALLPAPAAVAPLPAAELASALANALGKSGLFYEAHLAQWFSGTRPLHELLAEPQAHFAQADTVAEHAHADTKLLNVMPQDAAQAAWLVSLQLDALEHRRIAWQGELWPGQPLRWDVAEDQPPPSANTPPDKSPGWQSTISITLPRLGAVTATLTLDANEQLRIAVHADDSQTAAILKTQGQALTGALDAAGTTLALLTVRA